MAQHHVLACLFGGGEGIPARPGFPKPGTDRLYFAPWVACSRGYGITPDGFSAWVFGESSPFGDPSTQDPANLDMKDKRFIIRSMRVWTSTGGELIFANRKPGTAWASMPRRMVFTVTPSTPFSFTFGPLGVDLGDGAFVEWIGNPTSGRLWLEVAYDIR